MRDRSLQTSNFQLQALQVRREFLDPFFKALGWDVDNGQGHAEAYKDVIHEDAIKVGGATKAPDYCFRIGERRIFFLEAKKSSPTKPTSPPSAACAEGKLRTRHGYRTEDQKDHKANATATSITVTQQTGRCSSESKAIRSSQKAKAKSATALSSRPKPKSPNPTTPTSAVVAGTVAPRQNACVQSRA